MKIFLIRLIICSLSAGLVMTTALIPISSIAAQVDKDAHRILQDSLSIVELDHEIERISKEQEAILLRQKDLGSQLATQQEQIARQQEQAGGILRSYYMGERETWLTLLLNAHNLKQLFTLYDYYQLVIGHDHDILQEYEANYRIVKKTEQQTAQAAEDLASVKAGLIEQRKRIALLQSRVDKGLTASNDPEAIRSMIEEMTSYWENIGFYEVKKHFKALSQAMNDLPQFIHQQKGAMVTNGKIYTITIRENEFNQFLRSENDLFNNFNFAFEENKITVKGQRGTMQLSIEGHYTLENIPKNAILFHVDKLVFNGLELPDTTCKQLEQEFDLGFYPQQIIAYVKATEVHTSPQVLQVKLELSL